MADAGIEAAKRQLASGVDTTKYDDPVGAPDDDIQWSLARGGLTLNDLDGKDLDGAGPLEDPTPDSVNVTIEYITVDENFQVVSEGTYGDPLQQAKRKIEAVFEGVDPGGGNCSAILSTTRQAVSASMGRACP